MLCRFNLISMGGVWWIFMSDEIMFMKRVKYIIIAFYLHNPFLVAAIVNQIIMNISYGIKLYDIVALSTSYEVHQCTLLYQWHKCKENTIITPSKGTFNVTLLQTATIHKGVWMTICLAKHTVWPHVPACQVTVILELFRQTWHTSTLFHHCIEIGLYNIATHLWMA